MRLIPILMALLPLSSAASTPPADSINDLFAGTCMKHFYAQDGLRQAMSDGAPEVPPEKAEFFLGNKAWKAWFISAPSTAYVVALRDDSVCAVFARRADPVEVRAGFVELVGTAPEPLVAQVRDSAAPAAEQDAHVQTVSYAWTRAQDKDELLFVLSTTDSSEATAQAMVSISLVDKVDVPR